MKKTDGEDLKKDTNYILQGVGAGLVLCLGFAAGVTAKKHFERPAKLSIITNKAITRPGVRITPNKFKNIIGVREFIFNNCKEANEFVNLFNECIIECTKNVEG